MKYLSAEKFITVKYLLNTQLYAVRKESPKKVGFTVFEPWLSAIVAQRTNQLS